MRRHFPLPSRALTATTLAVLAIMVAAPLATASTTAAAEAAGSSGITGSADITGSTAVTGPAATGSVLPESFTDPYSTETQDNVVAFGDSFTANSATRVNENPDRYPTYPRQAGCLIAPEAWPALLGTATGHPVQNWACNAHTTSDMLGRIAQAIAAGDINNSSTVVLAAGMNDKWAGVSDATVTANLVTAVDRVRKTAPQARILILGRLATTDATGRFCSRNEIPDHPRGDLDPTTAAYEEATRRNQQSAAEQSGVPFLDIRSLTVTAHSSCAPDAGRYVSGLIDRTTPGVNMPGHPSLAGSRFLADRVAAAMSTTDGGMTA